MNTYSDFSFNLASAFLQNRARADEHYHRRIRPCVPARLRGEYAPHLRGQRGDEERLG